MSVGCQPAVRLRLPTQPSTPRADTNSQAAAGSGVYVWHVDEGVIQDAFDAPGNLFNADPDRKSVDLEEADGLDELDVLDSQNGFDELALLDVDQLAVDAVPQRAPLVLGQQVPPRTVGDALEAVNARTSGGKIVIYPQLTEMGMVTLGKSSMSEFGFVPSAEPHHMEPTRNPWNPAHTTGGSSGGVEGTFSKGTDSSGGGCSITVVALASSWSPCCSKHQANPNCAGRWDGSSLSASR